MISERLDALNKTMYIITRLIWTQIHVNKSLFFIYLIELIYDRAIAIAQSHCLAVNRT